MRTRKTAGVCFVMPPTANHPGESTANLPYGAFNRFLENLARYAGIDPSTITSDSPITDPIIPLLASSDEGMSPEHCRMVAPRMRSLVESYGDEYDRDIAPDLADIMDQCAWFNVPMLFR